MVRIAFCVERAYPYYGGCETRYHQLASHLAERGHDVKIITGKGDITGIARKDLGARDHEWVNGYEITRIIDFHSTAPNRSLKQIIKFGFALRTFIRHEGANFDVIDFNVIPHLHLPIIAMGHQLSTVVTWHEVLGEGWRTLGFKMRFLTELERINAEAGHEAIAVSEFTKNRLRALGREDVQLIPNGVPDSFFQRHSNDDEDPHFLYVGRLVPEKHVSDLLIPAFHQVKRKFPDATLDIVGAGGESDKISLLAKQDKQIVFHGSVTQQQLELLYGSSNVLVLPSSREGSSVVVKEANAFGIPAVSTDFPHNAAAHDTIHHKETGIVVPPEKLAQGMVEGFVGRQRLGQAARELTRPYTWQKLALQVESIYETISGQ